MIKKAWKKPYVTFLTIDVKDIVTASITENGANEQEDFFGIPFM